MDLNFYKIYDENGFQDEILVSTLDKETIMNFIKEDGEQDDIFERLANTFPNDIVEVANLDFGMNTIDLSGIPI